ncbi:MAG: endonuclease/exonuclease/phosphatase family protein [Chloroflexota bacterium]
MIARTFTFILVLFAFVGQAPAAAQADTVPIGAIQGTEDSSPYVGQRVNFQGVVTGFYEDQNSRGDIFYLVFVQNDPAEADGNPATSDAIAVFLGRQSPAVQIGDRVLVKGIVTEFFGLTEIDNDFLGVEVLSQGNPLPPAVVLQPPADEQATAAYYEPLESALATLEGAAVVVGATHSGCGFAVVPAASGLTRVFRHVGNEPIHQIVPVLHNSDVDCTEFPDLRSGDQVTGLSGPLTYNFDQFKIVQQSPDQLVITPRPETSPPTPPPAPAGSISIATFNLLNYFDTVDDTGDVAEPKPTAAELATKQAKLAYAIGRTLACPTFVGVQEVEKESLLLELASQLTASCGFTYAVSHRESPDPRGIDVALLSDPRRVAVEGVSLRQTCSVVNTDLADPTATCPAGQQPLFARPPIQVDVSVDGRPLTLLVNHFKSKSGGEAATAAWRMAEARFLRDLTSEWLSQNAQAPLVVMGDFNDYLYSEMMLVMAGDEGPLVNVLEQVAAESRYSYVFGGASQLIDGILISPALVEQVAAATILHVNADYPHAWQEDTTPAHLPYHASDHDIPYLALYWSEPPATPTATPIPAAPAPEQPISSGLLIGLGVVVGVALIVAVRWLRRPAARKQT